MAKLNLKDQHGQNCPWCNAKMSIFDEMRAPTRDHLVPRCRDNVEFKMGPAKYPLLVIVCKQCNNDKSDMHIDDFIRGLKEIDDPRYPVIKRWAQNNYRMIQSARSRERRIHRVQNPRPRLKKKDFRGGLTPQPDP